jgi:hypothetical protein
MILHMTFHAYKSEIILYWIYSLSHEHVALIYGLKAYSTQYLRPNSPDTNTIYQDCTVKTWDRRVDTPTQEYHSDLAVYTVSWNPLMEYMFAFGMNRLLR